MPVSIIKNAGLNTSDNPLSSVKDGSFKTANNVVIRANNVVEPRRGQALETNAFASSTANTFAFFDSGRVVHHNTTALAYATTGTYTAISGSYTPPAASTLRMKFAEMGNNLHFTTTTGIKTLNTLSTAPRWAGVPTPSEYYVGLYISTAAGVWLPADSAVAYRVTYVYKDDSGREYESAPSGRMILINPPAITTSVVLSRTSNVVTATFTTAHGFKQGDYVSFTGAADGTFNPGPHQITSVPTSLTFKYTETAANGSSGSTHTFGGPAAGAASFIELPSASTSYVAPSFVRFYRSAYTEAATIMPDDEMYRVYETSYANGDGVVTSGLAGVYVWVDYTPESALYSIPLYTNPRTGAGIVQANNLPPLSKDVCGWQERLWFANTTQPYRLGVQLLGLSAPNGWQNNDTVTVGTVVYTAKTAPSVANDVQIATSGSASANIEATARRLVATVNYNFYGGTSTVRAFYTSGDGDAPGKITFEEFGVGGATFTFATSRAAAWSPSIASSSATNDSFVNRIYYSKYAEHEAAPLLNYLDVGARNKAILRIMPLRDKLFVFKEDAIYTISGDPGFGLRVDLLDATAWIMAPDSLVAANNRLYCLTNQGFVAVSEGGVEIISRGIEDQIASGFFRPIAAGTTAVKAMVWGTAYDSERQVLFGLTTSASSTTADQVFVYNYLLNSWTRWDLARKFAAVDPATDKLWSASATASKLLTERKTYTYADYADSTTAITVSSYDTAASTVTVVSAVGLSVGDGIIDSVSTYALITAINGSVLSVYPALSRTGAATAYAGYQVTLEYNPIANPPATLKQFSEATLHFNLANFYDLDATFRTDHDTTSGPAALTTTGFTIAAEPTEMLNHRLFVPLEKQRGTLCRLGMSIREAWAKWQLNGATVEATGTSERNSR